MTGKEWLECTAPGKMLEQLRGKVNDRKFFLFACACYRRMQHVLPGDNADRIAGALERFAEGEMTTGDMRASDLPVLRTISDLIDHFADSPDFPWQVASMAAGGTLTAALIALSNNPSLRFLRSLIRVLLTLGGAQFVPLDPQEQATLLRHIMGNPFRPLAKPESWPSPVESLAEAVYRGDDCSFALHDALLEAGHPDLAEHFQEPEHPKGCWALDAILGKM